VNAEARLDRLWSVHEIRQLVYRYAWAHDACDAELLESLWVETAEPLDPPEIDIHRVRAVQIPRLATRGLSVLFVGNHIVDFDDDDHARGTVYCWAQLDLGDRFVDQSIVYRDRYLRHDGRWLFVSRRHLLWYGEGRRRHPLAQPPAEWPASPVGAGVATGEIREGNE
jgi:hypothetical protein